MKKYYCYWKKKILFPCFHQEDYFHYHDDKIGSQSFYKEDCVFDVTQLGLTVKVILSLTNEEMLESAKDMQYALEEIEDFIKCIKIDD